MLVTGAAGFIGSHVAESLLRRGTPVVGLDNLDSFYDPALKRANLADVARTARDTGVEFRFVEADIRDERAVGALFEHERFAGVIHLAARAGVRPSIAEPALYASVNVVGTSVVLTSAGRAGCPRFVAASSSSVYGNNPKTPFSEDDPVDHPISPYAATKRGCELVARACHHLTGMPIAVLRLFTVYGPRQRPDLAIAQFLAKASRGEAIRVFGDGSSSRDYTYVDDVVGGVLSAFERVPGFGYRVWNLGSSRPITLAELIASVERVVGRRAAVERLPAQAGDVERTFADVSRSAAELGYRPVTPFEEGLKRQWEWQRGSESSGRSSRG